MIVLVVYFLACTVFVLALFVLAFQDDLRADWRRFRRWLA